MNPAVDRESISAVEKLIRPYIRRTPIIEAEGTEFGLDCARVIFKLELFQHSGSFKARGAFANLLMRNIPPGGVVAASGGNHGAAVAFAARRFGKPAKIFVPSISSPEKIAKIRDYGAELVIGGEHYSDALAASEIWARQSGALPIHAYDQVETLLGQGTAGLEFEEQYPALDSLLVAVGGGGLIGGVASWYSDRIRIVGVEPEMAPTLSNALQAGKPVDSPAGGIAADSLGPKRVGDLAFSIAQRAVDCVVLVPDKEILRAQYTLWQTLRIVAEPGGAAAFTALLSRRYKPRATESVGVLICGGNTSAVNFDSVFSKPL